jgi:DNA-binding MarR family transcriptional regulator
MEELEKRKDSIPGMMFHSLHRVHMNAVQTIMTQRGLQDLGSPMILFILQHRGQNGEIAAQRELADQLHVSPATIATSLKSLERLGYVEKSADAQDARRKRISITPKGTEAVEKCRQIFNELDRWMMEGLTEAESETLDKLHERMLNNLREKAGWEKERRGECP